MRNFTEAQKEELEEHVGKAKNTSELKRVQAVWMRASINLSAREIADVLCWNRQSVRQIQHRYFAEGIKAFDGPGRGGRRRSNLSVQDEADLLKSFEAKAERAGILHVLEIKKAYEGKVGRAVPKSTVYRMLKRHGWRKLAPRPKHPDSDPVAAEEFKKNSRRMSKRRSGFRRVERSD